MYAPTPFKLEILNRNILATLVSKQELKLKGIQVIPATFGKIHQTVTLHQVVSDKLF